MVRALMAEAPGLHVRYNRAEKELIGTYGGESSTIKYVGRIDAVRQSNEEDVTANIYVHESGHAVVYMILTGMVPLQLKSRVANSYAGGFTLSHQMDSTKKSLLDKVKIYLAGGLADEQVFGEENASVGRISDRLETSGMVADYIRPQGYDHDYQAVYNAEHYPRKMDWKVTDYRVEQMMRSLAADTKQLLLKHDRLLIELSEALNKLGRLDANSIKPIAEQHGLNVQIFSEGHLYITDYQSKLN
ncbi:hypothetical protein [Lewinella sp. 4G2]|uniref:hypothetical protein n=1 Tax=Lewinella sp. 4G2 TaxID=1803372 RepID=UPI0007B4C7F1|nr:hypothetical protein [Lewinella sp. 4G2]OAV44618.1 hypothetical protein A3850_008990 [Lewinella sp. 4G2]